MDGEAGEIYMSPAVTIVEENLESFIRTMQAMVAIQAQLQKDAILLIERGLTADEVLPVLGDSQQAGMIYRCLDHFIGKAAIPNERKFAIARDVERERRMIDALR